MSLAQDIAEIFWLKDYRWNFDGVLKTPTPEDISGAIDKAVRMLYAEPDGTQLEVGRLIIKKRSRDLHDVFVHIGQLPEDDEDD